MKKYNKPIIEDEEIEVEEICYTSGEEYDINSSPEDNANIFLK